MATLELPEPVPYADADAGSPYGDLRVWRDTELPGLGRRADVTAWLPPGYRAGETAYPVVYLQDGGNLYDPAASFAGETWRAHEALGELARRGIEVIAIGVPCHPTLRHEEYTPHADPVRGGGRGDDYVTFLADALKPAVDAALRTRPGRNYTLVAGSSLGGVISLHAWHTRQDIFGGAGCFSPAFWWSDEQLRRVHRVLSEGRLHGRLYVDVGGHEEPGDPETELAYVSDAEELVRRLRDAGVPVRYVYDSSAYHFETAWAERLPAALAWLLRGYAVAGPQADDPLS